ncbi:hypothetical protein ACRAWF_14365 [Streptomyces sp. L7]
MPRSGSRGCSTGSSRSPSCCPTPSSRPATGCSTTVREYGADWLHALGEERAARRRHRDHYARLAREGCAEWNTGRQVAWVRGAC